MEPAREPGAGGPPAAGPRISRSFAFLGGGEAFARLISFAATIYIARSLGPTLYGIVGVAAGIMLYLTQLADGGVELVGLPAIARARNRVAEIAGPVVAYRFLLALGIAIVTLAIGSLALPQPDGAILAIFSLSLLPTALSTRWILLGLERSEVVAVGRIGGEALALAIIVLSVHRAGDIATVPLAQFAGTALTSLVLLIALRRSGISIPLRRDWPAARPFFERSRYLIGFTLLGLVMFNFDLILLRIVSGAADAGYYAAAYTFISFAANIIVAYAHSVMPSLARLGTDAKRRDALYQTSIAQAFALALPVAVGAHLIAPTIIHLMFGDRFGASVTALRWLLWTIPLAALREIPVVGLIAAQSERALLRINTISAVCNVILTVALVPKFTLVGAAAATLATEFIRLALAIAAARRVELHTAVVSRLVKPVIATAVMALIVVALGAGNVWIAVPAGALGYALTLVVLGALKVSGKAMPELTV